MSDNERYIEYPRVEDLYRMRTYIERSLVEIEYDMERNKQRAIELVKEREQSLRSLREIDAYIKVANNAQALDNVNNNE